MTISIFAHGIKLFIYEQLRIGGDNSAAA